MTAAAVDITINGERRSVSVGSSAFDVLVELGLGGRPVAVEVNEQVVPRAQLAACMLREGDRLEIVTLVGGG